jgi:hypothetical protein
MFVLEGGGGGERVQDITPAPGITQSNVCAGGGSRCTPGMSPGGIFAATWGKYSIALPPFIFKKISPQFHSEYLNPLGF